MRAWRHRLRVWFNDAKGRTISRDISAQTSSGAVRTAKAVERMLGTRGKLTLNRVEDLGHMGTDAAYGPVCSRKPSLFPVEAMSE